MFLRGPRRPSTRALDRPRYTLTLPNTWPQHIKKGSRTFFWHGIDRAKKTYATPFLRRQRDGRRLERDRQNLIDRTDDVKRHLIPDVGGNIVQIRFVPFGDNHFRETGRVRRKHLLLET